MLLADGIILSSTIRHPYSLLRESVFCYALAKPYQVCGTTRATVAISATQENDHENYRIGPSGLIRTRRRSGDLGESCRGRLSKIWQLCLVEPTGSRTQLVRFV